MIKKIDIEYLFKVQENNKLFSLYAEESKSDLAPTLNPSLHTYLSLEQAGILFTYGTFIGNNLVGFIISMVTILPHYTSKSVTIESFYVLPEYRKFGTGKKLLRYVEEQAINKGATMSFMSAPRNSRLELAAGTLGYTNTHSVFTKSL